MEQVPEELSQVRVVRLVIKTQRTAEIQVRGKLGCKTRNSELTSNTPTGNRRATGDITVYHPPRPHLRVKQGT